jgi:hypothetical protein
MQRRLVLGVFCWHRPEDRYGNFLTRSVTIFGEAKPKVSILRSVVVVVNTRA